LGRIREAFFAINRLREDGLARILQPAFQQDAMPSQPDLFLFRNLALASHL
jgi:hypothetical protein